MDEREPEAIVRTVRKRELSIIKEDRPLSSLVLLTYTQYIYIHDVLGNRAGKKASISFSLFGKMGVALWSPSGYWKWRAGGGQ